MPPRPEAKALPNLPFPIQIGDIGGSNARFAILNDAAYEERAVLSVETYACSPFEGADESAILPRLVQKPRSAILAHAEPIDKEEIRVTGRLLVRFRSRR
ncbi:glucokinase [Neorhizobium alkalisoli]|uniref:glucokinase n=1 Tax=Neorhizobium alkalisoli TaxID=528178 RepID=UPI0016479EA4